MDFLDFFFLVEESELSAWAESAESSLFLALDFFLVEVSEFAWEESAEAESSAVFFFFFFLVVESL